MACPRNAGAVLLPRRSPTAAPCLVNKRRDTHLGTTLGREFLVSPLDRLLKWNWKTVVWPASQLQRDVSDLCATNRCQSRLASRKARGYPADEFVRAHQRLAIKLDDDVAGPYAC